MADANDKRKEIEAKKDAAEAANKKLDKKKEDAEAAEKKADQKKEAAEDLCSRHLGNPL